MVKRSAILRSRGIESDPGTRVSDLGHKLCLVRGRGDQRLHAYLKPIQRPPRLCCSCPHRGQHLLLDVGWRAYRMRSETLGDFASHLTHDQVHRREMNGNFRMLDRTRIEQWHHQIDVVMRSPYVERCAVLPTIPDRANSTHVLAHPRRGRRPG